MPCAKVVEPRISSPIAKVSCGNPLARRPWIKEDMIQRHTSFSFLTLLLSPDSIESF
jgi:hypothetical protein